MILEPTEEEEGNYTVPSYNFVKGNSRSVHIGLRNLSCRTVTLKKGAVVAQLSPANAIPKMLAPKYESVDHELEFVNKQELKNDKLEFVADTNSVAEIDKRT